MSGVSVILAAGSGTTVGAFLIDGNPSSIGSGTRTTTMRVANDGYVYFGDNAVYTSQYLWLKTGAVADYDIYATVSGSVSGTTGSWLNLATTRDWSVVDTTNDGTDVTGVLTLSIRKTSTGVTECTAVITLYSERIL